ncbi:MAG: hypothetical protein ABI168_00425 [Ginsengibacter sp.]
MNITGIKKNSIAVILIMFLLPSCTKWPCIADFDPATHIEIQFTDRQGKNLVFGPQAIYNIDSIRVLKEKNNQNINNASVRKGLVDSNNVRFDFYIKAEKSYIYYNSINTDSLRIVFISKIGKVCGHNEEYKAIDSLFYNNNLVKPVNEVYHFVQ